VEAVAARDPDGATRLLRPNHVFSSMPLRHLLRAIRPAPPAEVLEAAGKLAYRDFLTVALVLDAPRLFPDNWIYVHSPEVRVGRVQNFGNWSEHLLADPATSCVGMEYFVSDKEPFWSRPDADLVQFAYGELRRLGLADAPLLKGYVVRVPKAYPVYDPGYQERLAVIRCWLGSIDNLWCIGRNGQHRYNNQDHSMATALIAARNAALGQARDPWAVNEDAEYHEIAQTERQAPVTPAALPKAA
jgi:protoporphyrinogen oxidase